MRPLVRGFRPALRALARHRAFTLAAVLTLGLGMGAATAVYTLLERVVLDPLPYPHADRLVRLDNAVPGVGANTVWQLSAAQYFYFTRHATAFAKVGLFGQQAGILSASNGEAPQRVVGAFVTAPTLDLLGAHVVRGRAITRADDAPGAPPVVVLSNAFWRRQFGASDAVLGATVRLNDEPVRVVGVMASGIDLPAEPGEALPPASDLWMPMQLDPAGPFYNNHVLPAMARLAPGVSVAAAQAQLDRLTPRLAEAFPTVYSAPFFSRFGFRTQVIPLKAYVVGRAARYLWILFGAVGLVLAIAAANVANLLLVRLDARRRELAIRTALGAGARDLAGEIFREGLLLAVVGCVLAVALGDAAVRWLVALAPPGVPRLAHVRPDAWVLLFTLMLAVGVAAVLALVGMLQLRGVSSVAVMGDGGRTATAGIERTRLRGILVVSQVALALVLLVGSGLLLRSFARLRAVNPGFDPRGVMTVDLYLPPQRRDSASRAWQFYQQVLARVRALPGVQAAGLSAEIPLEGGYGCTVQGFEDAAVYQRIRNAGLTTCAGQEPTSPGYFRAMGIPILRGRDFTDDDDAHPETRAVIVSQAYADRFWPGENPLGKGVGPNGLDKPFYHVVGVVGDVHASTVEGAPAIAVYYPMVADSRWSGWSPNSMTLVVRTGAADPLMVLPAIRAIVSRMDPTVALADAGEMSRVLARSMSQLAFTMTMLGIAGITALLLAAVGLYGVISYLVARRTHELGVRLALGARPGQVMALVVRGALGLTLIGVVAGSAAALAFARVLGGLLYGVATWDAASYGAAALLVGVVAAVAGWVPARRAAAVSPLVALRSE